MQAREFNSAAELMSHYEGVRSRLRAIVESQKPLALRLPPPPKKKPVKQVAWQYHEPAPYDECRPASNRKLARDVLREVAAKHSVTVDAIVGPMRGRWIIPARQEAAFRIAAECRLSLPVIGRILNRDHTTVLYSVQQFIKRNPDEAEGFIGFGEMRQQQRAELVANILRLHEEGRTPTEIASILPTGRTFAVKIIQDAMAAGERQAA